MLRRRRHAPARSHGLDILTGSRPGGRPAAGPATMDPEDLLATPPVADDLGAQLAARPPRAKLPKLTLALAAAVLIGAGFLGGLTVGKSSASTGSGGLPAGLAAGFPGGGSLPSGGPGAGGSGTSGGGTGGGGSGQGAGGSGLPGGFSGSGTVGTIKLVDGHTIYVQTFSGSITRVSTSGSTKIQVTATGTVKDLQPGQTVVVQGSKRSDGSVAATSVSQSSLGGGGG